MLQIFQIQSQSFTPSSVMFAIINIQNLSHAELVATFMIYLYAEFHVSISSDPSVTAIRNKVEYG
jgi:hypothetical protein